MTDLVKGKAGCDDVLEQDDFDVASFKEKMEKINPYVICFNGKLAAATYFGKKRTNSIGYGFQGTLGSAKLFVAPSTPGAANRY